MSKLGLSILAAAIGIAGCSRPGVDEEDIKRVVDQRLRSYGIAMPDASASASAPSATPRQAPADAAAASLELLASFDRLMEGYEPSLPPVEDKTDVLRCTTDLAVKSDKDLGQLAAKAQADRTAAEKVRRGAERDFRERVRPLNNRIDYDWKTHGGKQPAQYGCWAFSPGGGMAPGWVTRPGYDRNAGDCADFARTAGNFGYSIQTDWRVRVPEGAFKFTYSQTTEAPTAPPELMRRIDLAKIAIPGRFACRVDNVKPSDSFAVVLCQAPADPAPLVRLSGELPNINVGDLVSVPLRDARRDPDGVLLKWDGGSAFRKGKVAALRWTVDSDGKSVKIEQAAACPASSEIRAALQAPDGGT